MQKLQSDVFRLLRIEIVLIEQLQDDFSGTGTARHTEDGLGWQRTGESVDEF